MSGHSKWANTKHRKAAQDAKREKIFTKIIREIISATKLGGSNPMSNNRLKTAIDKAIAKNMTRDTITRAISRGRGSQEEDKDVKNTIIYEGYGPGGTAILIKCLTNNRNRTISELRRIFSKNEGTLVPPGSISYLFRKKRLLTYVDEHNQETLLNIALQFGAEDIISRKNDNKIDIFMEPELLNIITPALEAAGFSPESSDIKMIPIIKVKISLLMANQLMNLIHLLKIIGDVQEISHNADLDDHPELYFQDE
ncbi:MAG: YebC/PmpR family DNA-binding transcriptional regulator [Candidatus Dasytiphilus stammeri]